MCFFFCLSTELFCRCCCYYKFWIRRLWCVRFLFAYFSSIERGTRLCMWASKKIKCRKYRNLCVCICVHEYEYLVTIFLFVSLLRSWDRAGRHWIKIKISFQLNICARCFSVLNQKKKSLHHSVNSIRSNSNVCTHSPLILHWFWYNNIICVYNNLVSLWVQHFQRVFFCSLKA